MTCKEHLLTVLTKSVLITAKNGRGDKPCKGPFYQPKPPVMTEEAEKKLKEVLR